MKSVVESVQDCSIEQSMRMTARMESCADSPADFIDKTAQKLEGFGDFEVLQYDSDGLSEEQKRQRKRWPMGPRGCEDPSKGFDDSLWWSGAYRSTY